MAPAPALVKIQASDFAPERELSLIDNLVVRIAGCFVDFLKTVDVAVCRE
jgi:hypothetical protein